MNDVSLELKIQQELDAVMSAQANIRSRWDAIQNLYYVDPVSTNANVIEGMNSYAVSLWRIKADKIVSETSSSLMSLSPVIQMIEDVPDGKNEGDMERAIQALLQRGSFEDAFSVACLHGANTNLGPMRIKPVPTSAVVNGEVTEKVALAVERFDPRHFFCYPFYVNRITDASLVGHRFYQSVREIKQKFEDGLYTATVEDGGDDPFQYTRTSGQIEIFQNVGASFGHDDNDPVECFELIRMNEDGGRDLIVYAYRDRKILKMEPYIYEVPWYTAVRYCNSEETVYSNDSLGYSVQGYCLQHADLMNAIVGGSLFSCYGAWAVSGVWSSEKVLKVMPGDLVPVPDGANITPLVMPFNPNGLMLAAENIANLVDQTLGISALASSGTVDPNTKATAINVQSNADQRKMAGYLRTVAMAVKDAGEIVLELYRRHYKGFVAQYGPAVALQDPAIRMQPYRLEVTGQSGESNPDVMMNKLTIAAQLAMRPGSSLDPNKIDKMTMQSLHFPLDPESLERDGLSDITQAANELLAQGIDPMQVLQMGMQFKELQHELNNAGIPGTNDPQPGMGAPQGDDGGLQAESTEVIPDSQGYGEGEFPQGPDPRGDYPVQ